MLGNEDSQIDAYMLCKYLTLNITLRDVTVDEVPGTSLYRYQGMSLFVLL